MKKILVTTDFSPNSIAGISFAIQLAGQNKSQLTFFHSYYCTKPTSWSDATFSAFEKTEAARLQATLTMFIQSVYDSLKIAPKSIHCEIRRNLSVETNILEYSEENQYDFICISTRGAGKLKKIFGTVTSKLITHSRVPVIAVPFNYTTISAIESVLYISDLTDLKSELKEVVNFAKSIMAEVELLYFKYPTEKITEKSIKETISKYNIHVNLVDVNLAESLVSNISAVEKRIKPSLIIMYTKQNRSFFEKMFLSSKSAEYTFTSKTPLLVIPKKSNDAQE